MTIINPLAAVATGTTSPATSATTTSASATSGLAQLSNPQMFLQLLVSELENQDPLDPTSASSMLSQTSQLASMEATQQMETSQASATSAEQLGASTSLIGKQISATASDGTTTSGVVTGVTVDPTAGAMLDVNGLEIPLSDVTQVLPVATG
jgi:flagellar basal-body rod modification protein FlgD